MNPQVAMTFPLLVGTDGKKKMSQSLNNYISITDTPENIYGKIMSIPDEIMWEYFTMLTDLELTEIDELKNSNIIIWTTTPWTIPGNRAVAYKGDLKYLLIEVLSIKENSIAKISDKIIVAEELLDSFIDETLIEKFNIKLKFEGKELEGTILKHPLFDKGYDFEVPVLEAEFVTTEQGTGFVHIAPGHGADDFELGVKHSLPTPETVEDDGFLKETLPLLGGLHVLRDNEKNSRYSE